MKTTKELLEEKAKLEQDGRNLQAKLKKVDEELLNSFTEDEFIDSLNLLNEEKEILQQIRSSWELDRFVKIPSDSPYLRYTKTQNGIIVYTEVCKPSNSSCNRYFLTVFSKEGVEIFHDIYYDLEELEDDLNNCFSMVEVKYNIPVIYQHHKLLFQKSLDNKELTITSLIPEDTDMSKKIISERDLTYNPEKDIWE